MIGPPGSGKTMLARRLPTILPPLDDAERLETALVHSVAGLDDVPALAGVRPFRAPHHSASIAGLVGGGSPPRPGEASLAHNGVLFLDEMPEFGPAALQALRQPLEDGRITLVRAEGRLRFPARFALVGAANPCPCGFRGDSATAVHLRARARRALPGAHRRAADGPHRPGASTSRASTRGCCWAPATATAPRSCERKSSRPATFADARGLGTDGDTGGRRAARRVLAVAARTALPRRVGASPTPVRPRSHAAAARRPDVRGHLGETRPSGSSTSVRRWATGHERLAEMRALDTDAADSSWPRRTGYPEQLAETPDPPRSSTASATRPTSCPGLRSSAHARRRRTGCRRAGCSRAGRRERASPIISGGAIGCDQAAHRAALSKTVRPRSPCSGAGPTSSTRPTRPHSSGDCASAGRSSRSIRGGRRRSAGPSGPATASSPASRRRCSCSRPGCRAERSAPPTTRSPQAGTCSWCRLDLRARVSGGEPAAASRRDAGQRRHRTRRGAGLACCRHRRRRR